MIAKGQAQAVFTDIDSVGLAAFNTTGARRGVGPAGDEDRVNVEVHRCDQRFDLLRRFAGQTAIAEKAAVHSGGIQVELAQEFCVRRALEHNRRGVNATTRHAPRAAAADTDDDTEGDTDDDKKRQAGKAAVHTLWVAQPRPRPRKTPKR